VGDRRIRTQQRAFNPTEDGGIGADAESEAKHRQETEARTAAKHPQAETQVGYPTMQAVEAAGFAAFFLIFLRAAELEVRPALGLVTRDAGTLKIRRALGDVELDLFFEGAVEAFAPEEAIKSKAEGHGSDLLRTRLQDHGHGGGEAVPAFRFVAKMLLAFAGQAVVLGAAVVF
jgi:hypothetical protein